MPPIPPDFEDEEAARWQDTDDEEEEEEEDEDDNSDDKGSVTSSQMPDPLADPQLISLVDAPPREPDHTWNMPPLEQAWERLVLARKLRQAILNIKTLTGVTHVFNKNQGVIRLWSDASLPATEAAEAVHNAVLLLTEAHKTSVRQIDTERREKSGSRLRWGEKSKNLNDKMLKVLTKRKRKELKETRAIDLLDTEYRGYFSWPYNIHPHKIWPLDMTVVYDNKQQVKAAQCAALRQGINNIKRECQVEILPRNIERAHIIYGKEQDSVNHALDMLHNCLALYTLKNLSWEAGLLRLLDPPSSYVQVTMLPLASNTLRTPLTTELHATFEGTVNQNGVSGQEIVAYEHYKMDLQLSNVQQFIDVFEASLRRHHLWMGTVDMCITFGKPMTNVVLDRPRRYQNMSKFVSKILDDQRCVLELMTAFSRLPSVMGPLINFLDDRRLSGHADSSSWPTTEFVFFCNDKGNPKSSYVVKTVMNEPNESNIAFVASWTAGSKRKKMLNITTLCLESRSEASWALTMSCSQDRPTDIRHSWTRLAQYLRMVNGDLTFINQPDIDIYKIERKTRWSALVREDYVLSVVDTQTLTLGNLRPSDVEMEITLTDADVTGRIQEIEARHTAWDSILSEHATMKQGNTPGYAPNISTFFGQKSDEYSTDQERVRDFFGDVQAIMADLDKCIPSAFVKTA